MPDTPPLHPDFWQSYRAAIVDHQTNPCPKSRETLLKTYREWVTDFSPDTADDLVAQMRRRVGV